MKPKIIYNLTFEKQRMKNTLKRLDWFQKNKYELFFPKNINPITDSTPKSIKAIEKEYNKKIYEKAKNKLIKLFKLKETQFAKALGKIFGNKTPKTFKIYLTKYGVGGSYHLPNTIILNINYPKLSKTLFHEIIHLTIEKDIQKHKVNHWEKERIVDLILNSPGFKSLKFKYNQKNYHGVKKYIDPLFKKHFFIDQQYFYKQSSKKTNK